MDITSYLLGKQAGGGGGVIGEEINITPSTSEQIITPSEGKNAITKATVSAVDNTIDNNIIAGNIKKDVSILGVTGTLDAEQFAPHLISFSNINVRTDEQFAQLQNDINSIDSKNMTYGYSMFSKFLYQTYTPTLPLTLNLSAWNKFKPLNLNECFASNYVPFKVNISTWDLSLCKGFNNTFPGANSGNLIGGASEIIFPSTKQIIPTSWFTGMFSGNLLIENIDLDVFDNLSYVYVYGDTNGFGSMFTGCSNLKVVKMKNLTPPTVSYNTNKANISLMFNNCYLLERIDADNFKFTESRNSSSYRTDVFANCGRDLPAGTYTKVYVKDATEQGFILNTLTNIPSGWSTSNVIIAGSADDHRTD